MKEEILIAGFGGQGVISMGKILAYAGVLENYEVTWMPSYGPEMRGGTANVTVILSDSRISSPIVSCYDVVIALNQQAATKFLSSVKPGGVLLVNSKKIVDTTLRSDIKIYHLDATAASMALGNLKFFNMVVLGAFLELKKIFSIESVLTVLKQILPERHHKLIPKNQEAILRGMQLIEVMV